MTTLIPFKSASEKQKMRNEVERLETVSYLPVFSYFNFDSTLALSLSSCDEYFGHRPMKVVNVVIEGGQVTTDVTVIDCIKVLNE